MQNVVAPAVCIGTQKSQEESSPVIGTKEVKQTAVLLEFSSLPGVIYFAIIEAVVLA
jgi:hypothetical protein